MVAQWGAQDCTCRSVSPMPGIARRRWAAALTALLLAAPVAGCSGDDAEPSASEPSSSESASESEGTSGSPSATPAATTEPELPDAPAARNSQAGRRAFAEFVVERWGYALRTNDAGAVTGLSPRSAPCKGCAELDKELKTRRKQGWYVDFPGAKVVKVDVAPGEVQGVHVATARINVPASASFFDDGEFRNENKPRKGATFEVRMRRDGKRYVLLAFRVV